MPSRGEYPRPETYHKDPLTEHGFLFLGRHTDVREVLRDNTSNDPAGFLFSVPHYRQASKRTSHGPDLLIGTENGPLTGATRHRLRTILKEAWSQLQKRSATQPRLEAIFENSLEGALQRTRGSGRIDLVAGSGR